VFVELMPLLKQRTLLITVARIDEKLKVNVIPAKAKEGEDEALTTPLSYTGGFTIQPSVSRPRLVQQFIFHNVLRKLSLILVSSCTIVGLNIPNDQAYKLLLIC
jgi:hypothetical protein